MKYSVITINYNNVEGLRKTIESVVAQTFNDYEYIVIDGGSTDDSVSVIKEYSDRINYWVSEPDRGIYNAMNKGVAHAHGDYCIFINSGDCFYNQTVLEQVNAANPIENIVVGKVAIDNQDNIISPPPQGELSMYHLYSGSIPHQGSFIKTELLRKYPYDESLRISSDWKFFIQAIVMHNCSIRYIDDVVAKFDTEGFSTSNPDKMWREKEQVLNSMFPNRILLDYKVMKASECLTQTITPQLRLHFGIDRLLYRMGKWLLKLIK